MKHIHYINLNKGITPIVMFFFIAYYNQWQNPTAWIYLSMHGSYGVLWVFKSFLFPDKTWQHKVSLWFGLISWFSLALYWIPGWLVVSQKTQIPAWYLGLAISLFILGVFFHFTSDMQKYILLQEHPGILITNGLMSLSRNINYFGELLIYLSFALLPMKWYAFLPLMIFVIFYWSKRILQKERSMSNKPGFEKYKEKVKLIIPYIF
jgi:steroid 5-alpha reductase family enzyme